MLEGTGRVAKFWVKMEVPWNGGVLLNHPFLDGIFHHKPSSYWVTAIYGNPQIVKIHSPTAFEKSQPFKGRVPEGRSSATKAVHSHPGNIQEAQEMKTKHGRQLRLPQRESVVFSLPRSAEICQVCFQSLAMASRSKTKWIGSSNEPSWCPWAHGGQDWQHQLQHCFRPGVCNYRPPFWPPRLSHLLWPGDDVWTLKDCDMMRRTWMK